MVLRIFARKKRFGLMILRCLWLLEMNLTNNAGINGLSISRKEMSKAIKEARRRLKTEIEMY